MDRTQLDRLIPILFGLAVAVCALWAQSALLPVAVVGGVLLGIYFAVFRSRMMEGGDAGRQRNPR